MKYKDIIYRMLNSEQIALNVKTEEDANIFVEECRTLNIEDCSLTGTDFYNIYEDKTCFTLEAGDIEYCNIDYFKKEGYKIESC